MKKVKELNILQIFVCMPETVADAKSQPPVFLRVLYFIIKTAAVRGSVVIARCTGDRTNA